MDYPKKKIKNGSADFFKQTLFTGQLFRKIPGNLE